MSGACHFFTEYTAVEKLLKSFLFVACLLFTTTGWSQNYQTNINAASSWLASTSNPRVTLADGAIVDGANSARINPYFSNLGAVGFTKNSAYYPHVKNWMEWYWSRVSWPDKFGIYGSINDFDISSTGAETAVPDPDAQGNHHPDSTDAYAGTFLSLAYAYYQTGDPAAQSYITSIQPPNSNRLDYVGEVIISTKQSSGNNLTWARPDYNIEYLMDNCQAYRGLRDLANLYTAYGLTSQASFYNTHADQMLNGIQTALWNSANGDYYWYTTDTGTSGTVNWNNFYPDAVSQVFPIALGVIKPTDQRAINIWNTFQSHWKNQWTTLSTGDQYPWVIIGYVAALMGDTTDANTFTNNLQTTFVNNNFAGDANHFWSTNEAGYFIRMNALLQGSSGGTGGGTTISDIDNDSATRTQTATNQWISCSPDCGGPNTPTPPLVTQVTSPAEADGNAAMFQTDSGAQVDFSGDYWYVSHGALSSQISTLQYSFDLYVPSQYSSGGVIQAIEFECQQNIGGTTFNFAWQDDYNDTQQWRIFNYGTHSWESSGIPYTAFSGNTWHHIVANYHTSGNQVFHDSITIDGTVYTPTQNNIHAAPATGFSATFNNAFQLDLNSNGTGYYVYVDNMKITYQ
jgi:hypothetical protein